MPDDTQYLEELNPAQREAATHIEGPLLIVAGAGAGKTKTLTHRILHLIRQGVAPHEILAITFTNKAASELQERIGALISRDRTLNLPVGFHERPFAATFHRLCIHLLRTHASAFGIPKNFSIFDRDDSLRAVKRAIKTCDLDPKEWEPRKILNAISWEKGGATPRDAYTVSAEGNFYAEMVARVWEEYERALRKEKAFDFDDLLLETLMLLREHREVLAHAQSAWRYLHVDEYQDTNRVQFELVKLLADSHKNICAVGDSDQTIYSWRNADIKNIMRFDREFAGAKVVLLEENYRSTKTILAAANDVIAKNRFRHEKKLFTGNADGEVITIASLMDATGEADFVASESERLIAEGAAPESIAVLYRTNFQSRALEEAFLTRGVPYTVLGTRFFARKEVRDTLSYIRGALNPESFSDIERVSNVPPRGIGKVTLAKLAAGKRNELSGALRERVEAFYNLLARIADAANRLSTSECIAWVIKESGVEAHLKKSGDEESLERLANLGELITLAKRYDSEGVDGVSHFLEDAFLAADQDALRDKERAKGVRLMTVHAAKGLEFDTVFVTGLEQELFPSVSNNDEEERDSEEERRLFYVALTRARKKVYLTHAFMRTIFGTPTFRQASEFLSDIDPAYTEEVGEGVGDASGRGGGGLLDIDF